jgi:fibrillarin-like rRNA methylase
MVNYNQRTQGEIDLTNFYLEKWDKILYSTQPVDRAKAEKAILDAYHYLGLSAPKIYFLTSPSPEQCSTLKTIFSNSVCYFVELKSDLMAKLVEALKDKPHVENIDREHPTFYSIERSKSFVLVYCQ